MGGCLTCSLCSGKDSIYSQDYIDRPLTYGRLDLVYVAVPIKSHFEFMMYADLVAVTQVKTLQAR
jgi:hypothetical protein